VNLKIVLYSIAYSEGLVRELPYIPCFEERGLYHLADLRDAGTHVALVTSNPVSPFIVNYHLRELFGFGEVEAQAAVERLTLLSPRSREPLSLAELVLRDRPTMKRLEDMVACADTAILNNFSPSPAVELLGERLAVPVEERPFEVSQAWGSKSGSKRIFAGAGLAFPRGASEVCTSVADLLAASMELASARPPARKVLIKLDQPDWGDAIGNVIVDCHRLRERGDLRSAVVEIVLSWDAFVKEVSAGGAIVEEYVENVVCSPSGQGYIAEDGSVSAVSTHEQITVNAQYVGCRFPGRADLIRRVRSSVVKVGRALQQRGVHGTFGVDFIGLNDGRLLATEINLRKVGPTHAHAYARLARGRTPRHYVHRRFYRPSELISLSCEGAVRALEDHGLLFDRAIGEGAILHILGGLPSCGYVEITSIAPQEDVANWFDQEVQKVLLRAAKDPDDRGPLERSNVA
jgi:L-propargylglycine--L-glutamate ligase